MAIAATGVGAGDMITAAVTGAKFGVILLWSAAIGALFKFVLNEGIARWQLATGTTLLEGWSQRLHKGVSVYFIIYLVLWGFIVSGALISACGLAGHALWPGLSVAAWGMIHSTVAAALVFWGRYGLFERMMKFFIGLMFAVMILCAILLKPDPGHIFRSIFIPAIPVGSSKFILGVIGGVGGSVTILSYGYWIRERGWLQPASKTYIQIDLGIAYLLTGIFGIAVMVIAAGANPQAVAGRRMALEVAGRLAQVIGPLGKWTFLVGFWGAVFSSMLGVWQGIPYLFADFVTPRQTHGSTPVPQVQTHSIYYRGFLLFLAFPPMLLLLFGKPVWIVVIYSITGALFMPFLAATLLFMNNQRKWVHGFKNGWLLNLLLLLSLALFGYLGVLELIRLF
ncbi:MAG: iron transporter [Calditrichaeota bacterium]|nr:MAG: iron transporter [Calditrichota bacterium]